MNKRKKHLKEILDIEKFFGVKLYPSQIDAAIEGLNRSAIELPTGEGKTLTILLCLMLQLKKYRQVVIVTSNEYLSERDYEYSRDFLSDHSISSILVRTNTMDVSGYQVIYSTPENLVFYYLRGGELEFESVIIDEIDFVLVENALSNFSVTQGNSIEEFINVDALEMAFSIVRCFKGKSVEEKSYIEEQLSTQDVEYAYSSTSSWITTRGLLWLGQVFGTDNFAEDFQELYDLLMKVIECEVFMKEGLDYAVIDGKLRVINRYNGRVYKDSKFQDIIQNILEYRHQIELSPLKQLNRTMNYGVFFNKFKKLCGFSGTVMFNKLDFRELFNLKLVKVKPTFSQKLKMEYSPLYASSEEKIEEIKKVLHQNKNRSVLIAAYDEQELKNIKNKLEKDGFNVLSLDNTNLISEKEFLEKIGLQPQILISTKIISRGVHIEIAENLLKKGGLTVILTEHFEFRSIDRQIVGRTQRQGKPGDIYIFRSQQDNLFKNLSDKEKVFIEKNRKDIKKINNFVKKLQEKEELSAYEIRRENYYMSNFSEFYVDKLKDHFTTDLSNITQDSCIGELQQELSQEWRNIPLNKNSMDFQYELIKRAESIIKRIIFERNL